MSKMGMEREELSRIPDLPEELVERILGIVPFPYVFKARALSKSWLARFSPVSSHDNDEEKKRVAISFQRRMALDWSTKWPTFCPVLIGNEIWRQSVKEYVIGYDRASRMWKRLPSLSFLPENLQRSYMEIHGALLFIYFHPSAYNPKASHVASILTRSWKKLPPRPPSNDLHLSQRDKCHTHNVVSYAETTYTKRYKIVEFWENAIRRDYCLALIYDSKEDAWMKRMVEIPAWYPSSSQVHGRGVHFNGAIYWLVGRTHKPSGLLAFTVEEATFQVLDMPAPDIPFERQYHLVVCDGSLLLLILYNGGSMADQFNQLQRVMVMKIDLESQSWLEVTRGPPADHHECVIASDGDCIFIVGQFRSYFSGGVRVFESCYEYNVKNDEWSTFPLPGTEFYPRNYYAPYSPRFSRAGIPSQRYELFDIYRSSECILYPLLPELRCLPSNTFAFLDRA